jgi:hypothetical protein
LITQEQQQQEWTRVLASQRRKPKQLSESALANCNFPVRRKAPVQATSKKIKIIKKGSAIEKMPATTNTSLFQGDSGDLQSEDSTQSLTTNKNTEGDLPNPAPAMITQNPGTQESVSRTLDFGQDAAVAAIPVTNEQVEENSELVVGLQVADHDVQVEDAVLEEVIDEQVDEQVFVKETELEEGSENEATGAPKQVTTIEDEIILPSLAQCDVQWKLNNPQKASKHQWHRLLDPMYKIYESGKNRLPLERRPFEPGLDQWMTTYQSSALVRLCFPNIERGFIAKILTITANTASGSPVELEFFSLQDFLQLSPWNNEVANGSSLTCLSQFDVGKRSDGKTEVLKIRKSFELPSRRRVWVGFFHSAPENMENESNQMLIHSKRIHQLFLEEGNNAVGGTPSLKEMNKIVRYGECFFVTAIQGQVQQDHVLSSVQFKRWDNCTFINFLGTRPGTFSKTRFGNETTFMNEEETYQGMGLALLMLRSVQLYLCCLGITPRLSIQVVKNSRLHEYLNGIGLIFAKKSEIKLLCKNCLGTRILQGDQFAICPYLLL